MIVAIGQLKNSFALEKKRVSAGLGDDESHRG